MEDASVLVLLNPRRNGIPSSREHDASFYRHRTRNHFEAASKLAPRQTSSEGTGHGLGNTKSPARSRERGF